MSSTFVVFKTDFQKIGINVQEEYAFKAIIPSAVVYFCYIYFLYHYLYIPWVFSLTPGCGVTPVWPAFYRIEFPPQTWFFKRVFQP